MFQRSLSPEVNGPRNQEVNLSKYLQILLPPLFFYLLYPPLRNRKVTQLNIIILTLNVSPLGCEASIALKSN